MQAAAVVVDNNTTLISLLVFFHAGTSILFPKGLLALASINVMLLYKPNPLQ